MCIIGLNSPKSKDMKKVVIVIAILIIGAIVAYQYVFNKPHRDVAGEEASIQIEATQLITEYTNSAMEAKDAYLDQVVLVSGVVEETDDSGIKLASGVYCKMLPEEDFANLESGQSVTIKGRVIGYDDLFEEVKLDFCKIVEP